MVGEARLVSFVSPTPESRPAVSKATTPCRPLSLVLKGALILLHAGPARPPLLVSPPFPLTVLHYALYRGAPVHRTGPPRAHNATCPVTRDPHVGLTDNNGSAEGYMRFSLPRSDEKVDRIVRVWRRLNIAHLGSTNKNLIA